ncbi:hypothetical protein [Qingshengfaniella alkalisoli]|uniref:Uncharacterized protein n=1 Tax=Qingshengfaniella alkalisoli TaxID=2599296 RepID=A0A5B8J3C9_9RHOB|nr:hypothetical protein [Qingshengfaniella alkalisoli]QDY71591.1 hypothetical protein FPZ52_18130 [Qingshengfaniella alkalisoli]
MIASLSKSETRQAAEARAKDFRRLLLLVLVVEGMLGLLAMVCPTWVLGDVNETSRLGGALLLSFAIMHVPALLQAELYRLAIVLGVIARILIALTALFLTAGFNFFALIEMVFAVTLYVGFRTMVIAVLQARP